ncbi:MAG: hypothetical protein KF767_00215 [Bdellovibrionaceae bacterium]|nr:hypothetical protein [Pseudobdellovibrionaceae bacterium]
MKYGVLVTSMLLSFSAHAASPVTALYDNASFRTGLTLPFMVETMKSAPEAKITGLRVQSADAASVAAAAKCEIAVDKFLRTHFLLKCTEQGKFNVQIDIIEGSRLQTITYGPLAIAPLKPGYVEPVKPTDPTQPDPDLAKGREILNKKTQTVSPFFSCMNCHTTPDTYGLRTKATTATLMNLNSKTLMKDVPNLTREESALVLKYLRSITDGSVWP